VATTRATTTRALLLLLKVKIQTPKTRRKNGLGSGSFLERKRTTRSKGVKERKRLQRGRAIAGMSPVIPRAKLKRVPRKTKSKCNSPGAAYTDLTHA
jgi:hypothetical protein